jgi:hypothetical protein
MAIAPLDQRLNQILPEAAPTGTQPLEPMPAEQAQPEADIPSFEPGMPSMEEGTEVAGLFGAGSKALRGVVTRQAPKAERKLIPGPETEPGTLPEAEAAGRFKVIPEADQQLTDEVGRAVSRRQTFGITQGKPPEEAFNLSNYATEDAAGVVGGVADALGIKTKRVTFQQIKDKAAESGISEAFLSRLVSGDGKMLPSAVETYKALEVLESSANELDRLFKLVNAGQATDSQKLQLRQQIAFHGLLQKGVKGIQTETARALAVFRIPREGSADIVRQVLDEYGGDRALADMAKSYLTIESRAARNQMVEKSMFSSVKDIWFTTYINGLLSSAPTHVKNIVGNTFFGLYQIPERLVAGLYSNYLPQSVRAGEMPRGMKWFGDLVPGSADDKIAMDEALTMALSLRNGVTEGLEIAARAFKENQPASGDLATKVELQRTPVESMGESLQRITGVGPETWMGKAMDFYGTAVTLPGRALMTEDEFFKATFYRMQLNTLITRRGKTVYRDAIQEGASEADAMAKAEGEMVALFNDPPRDLDEAAMEFARRGTFTSELPPNLAALQKVFNHPLLKIVVPFFKTPANIGLEVVERTPFAPLSSRFRQDLAKGGIYRDMALAKVTLGSTLLTTFALMAGEGQITGGGPKRKAQREALERTGWKPYSIKIGDTYYSYNGLEPISAFVAMAADYSEYAINEPDSDKVAQVFMGGAFGLYEFMSEQPYLQGVAEIAKAAGLTRTGGELDGDAIMNNLFKQLGSFAIGGSPLPGTSALVASVERVIDPLAKDVKASPDLPMGVRGFVEAFNKYRNRLPYANENLPEQLNLWGDPGTQGYFSVKRTGDGPAPETWMLGMVLPTQVSPDKFSEVDDLLVRMGSPIGMPDRKMNGVELDAFQYNRLVTIYGKETPAKDEILKTMTMPGFDLLSLDDQQKTVQRVHSQYMDFAKKTLVAEDPILAAKIAEVEELRKAQGLYYKP